MSTRGRLAFVVAAGALLAVPARARAQATEAATTSIPTAYRPPPGMCRIWLAEVPPDKQPAPTDCTSAVRSRPPNGQVIFGDRAKTPRSRSWVEEIKALKDKKESPPRGIPPIRQLREPARADTTKTVPPPAATPKPKPPEVDAQIKPPAPAR